MYNEHVMFETRRLASILGMNDEINYEIVHCMEKIINCQYILNEIYIMFIMHQLSKKKSHHPVSPLDIKMGSSSKYRRFHRQFRTKVGKKCILSKLNHIKHLFNISNILIWDNHYTKNTIKGNLLFTPSPNYLKYLSHWTVSHSPS